MQPAKFAKLTAAGLSLAGLCCFAAIDPGPSDPGVQGANRGTGATIINAASDPNRFTAFFQDGFNRFQDVETVANSANVGLGPRFNSNQCSSCHAQPAVGGSSAAVNPQFQFLQNGVAPGNTIPSFITANGPTLEARFPFFFKPNGAVNTSAPNGGVEDLFTVTGRSDAGACSLPQPNFAEAQAANNIIFRIPTPVFGAFNRNGNDGTITRFGWKTQNKSLHIFAGEAYNVEMGISNELFQQDRPLPEEISWAQVFQLPA